MYQPSCRGLVLVLLYYEIYQTEDVLKTLGDIVSVIGQDEWQLVFCWHCSDSVVWRCASGCVVECRICNREVAGSNLNLLCTKVYSAFHPSWVGKWVPAIAEKAKAGMAHSDCGWMCGCAGKTVKSLENTCHTWALLRWWFTTKRRYIKCMHLYLYAPFDQVTVPSKLSNHSCHYLLVHDDECFVSGDDGWWPQGPEGSGSEETYSEVADRSSNSASISVIFLSQIT